MRNLVFVIALSWLWQRSDSQPVTSDTFDVKTLNAYAVQENVRAILAVFDTLPLKRLSPFGIAYREKYINRFVAKTEFAKANDEGQFTGDVLRIYRDYWNGILLKEKATATADSLLKENLRQLMPTYLHKVNPADGDTPTSRIFNQVSALLTQQGYFSYMDEKTGNLYDLFIWKRQDTVVYRVVLPEGITTVPVYLMKDIVTLGWIEYASTANVTPGGWPKNGALYCVSKSYDTASEKFKVSFLQHEAQHFHDKRLFASLPSWHLEYRAKLAELVSAHKTLENLLSDFSLLAKNDSTLPHPFGSYLVLKNLSALISSAGKALPLQAWQKINPKKISEGALRLLRRDTALLLREKRSSVKRHRFKGDLRKRKAD